MEVARFFETLTEDQAQRIVQAGVDMIRACTEVYGAEKGQEVWDAMSVAIGGEAKHAIFAAMLSGYQGATVTIIGRDYDNNQRPYGSINKVAAIKAARAATGQGLKEAKDLIESAYGHRDIPVKVEYGTRSEFLSALKAAGFEAR